MAKRPVFGSNLQLLKVSGQVDSQFVPKFVIKCIQRIESSEEYLSTQGVYYYDQVQAVSE